MEVLLLKAKEEFDNNLPDVKYTHCLSDGKYTHSLSDGKYTHSLSDGKYTLSCKHNNIVSLYFLIPFSYCYMLY